MIIYHEKTGIWHLTNDEISYIIDVMENGQIENLYYGKKIHDREDFRHLHEETGRSQMSVCVPEPSRLSLHYARQEYPAYGNGDYRSPAFELLQENGSRISEFRYVSHCIISGKPSLSPLPATYVTDDAEAETLEILLRDGLTGVELVLSYTIWRDFPVISRHARFMNRGGEKVTLTRAMSACAELNDMDFEMVHLSGAWGRERYIKRRPLEMGIQAIQGINGTACGAEHNPFLALARPAATEETGEVYGFSFVYSGNFLAQAEVSTFDMTRVMMGIHPQSFAWVLEGGAGPASGFTTPETVMVYSDGGFGKMSRVFHRLYRDHLMRGAWKNRPRPILLNNWEATYFDFDEEKLLTIARKAKEAGVELFVLDDGWFGTRNDDRRGLGDWYANLEKLPSGISGLSRKIREMGLLFGLWVELEMVNKDSDLYRAHPDWIIGVPGRFESHARHQHVLDYSRKEVVDAVYEMISKILRESEISYIKWDMNRYMTEPFSRALPAGREGELMHRYMLGVYDLYSRLTSEFPEILFESCASGGARFDPGMMYFAPQAWCSDDTDAAERQKIQYGTSLVYPLVSMGSHVSAVPNHQLLRTTPLATRANAAYFGTFGYELDLNLLTDAEMEQVKEQIRFMKKYRELIQVDGDFYRLLNPFEGNEAAWTVVSRDRTRALAFFGQRLEKVNGSWLRLRLAGLDPDRLYEVSCDLSPSDAMPEHLIAAYGLTPGAARVTKVQAYGDELMNAGIPIDRMTLMMKGGDFTSLLFEIEAL